MQRLKAQLEVKSPKTVNNILAVLSILLKKAVEWDVIERMPCTDQAVAYREGRSSVPRLRGSTSGSSTLRGAIDQRTYLIVLLGGEAGLRCGEMIALEWGDVDLAKRQLCVRGRTGTDRWERRRVDGSATCRSRDGSPRRSPSIGTCGASGCSARTIARRSRGRSCRTG